jgi:hypothetical protein
VRERRSLRNACLQRVLPARAGRGALTLPVWHWVSGAWCVAAAVREAWARLGFGTGSHLERLRVAAREGDKLWEAVRRVQHWHAHSLSRPKWRWLS